MFTYVLVSIRTYQLKLNLEIKFAFKLILKNEPWRSILYYLSILYIYWYDIYVDEGLSYLIIKYSIDT